MHLALQALETNSRLSELYLGNTGLIGQLTCMPEDRPGNRLDLSDNSLTGQEGGVKMRSCFVAVTQQLASGAPGVIRELVASRDGLQTLSEIPLNEC
jgi:hypothetical protein